MLTYIIRRILLMVPTIIGITIMVFLIARFAPGRPGSGQFGEGAQMDAQGRKQMMEWYEERYGLNLPLHEQYLRWWRGLFTFKTEARAWAAEDDSSTLIPVLTYRRPVDEYYTVDRAGGTWYVLKNLDVQDEILLQTDPAFDALLAPDDRDRLLEVDERYPVPRHRLAAGELEPIDPLDQDRLVPATEFVKIEAPAPAWTASGEPLYVDPENPESAMIYLRDDRWVRLTPDREPRYWSYHPQDDPAFKSKLPGREYRQLPPIEDDRPTPMHVIVSLGRHEPITQTYDAKQLTRKTVSTEVSIEAWLWTPEGWPIFKAAEPAPALFYQRPDGTWVQLTGPTRLDLPEIDVVEETDPAFWNRIPESEQEALRSLSARVADDRVPRHAIMTGEARPLDVAPEERAIRRYSHEVYVPELTLGYSHTSHTTVASELEDRIVRTLLINLVAFPIIYLVAIPTGMLMAVRRGKLFDNVASVVMLALWSVPVVLTGTLAIGYLAEGGKGVHWFPTSGLTGTAYHSLKGPDGWERLFDVFQVILNHGTLALAVLLAAYAVYMITAGYRPGRGRSAGVVMTIAVTLAAIYFFVYPAVESMTLYQALDRAWHLVLPVACIVYGGFAYLAKQMRASMLENFTMDYVRTAKAKGVPRTTIVFKHVLRNSLLPLITIFATILPALIAGSVFIEKIFNIEGMGLFFFRAVQNRDYDVVQSLTLIASGLTLLGLLIADICYAVADPRIAYK